MRKDLQPFDSRIVKFLGVKKDDYFGIRDWKNKFPDRKFTFPGLEFPKKKKLREMSAVPGKTIRQAIADGGYFVFVVPKIVAGGQEQRIDEKHLERIFKDKCSFISRTSGFDEKGKFKVIADKRRKVLAHTPDVAPPGLHIVLKDAYYRLLDMKEAMPANHYVHNLPIELLKQFLHFLKSGSYIKTLGSVRHSKYNGKKYDKIVSASVKYKYLELLSSPMAGNEHLFFLSWRFKEREERKKQQSGIRP